jgi:hypothetical protein
LTHAVPEEDVGIYNIQYNNKHTQDTSENTKGELWIEILYFYSVTGDWCHVFVQGQYGGKSSLHQRKLRRSHQRGSETKYGSMILSKGFQEIIRPKRDEALHLGIEGRSKSNLEPFNEASLNFRPNHIISKSKQESSDELPSKGSIAY